MFRNTHSNQASTHRNTHNGIVNFYQANASTVMNPRKHFNQSIQEGSVVLRTPRTDHENDAMMALKLQNCIPRPDTVDMQPRTQRYFSTQRASFNPFETFNQTIFTTGHHRADTSSLRPKSLDRSTIQRNTKRSEMQFLSQAKRPQFLKSDQP